MRRRRRILAIVVMISLVLSHFMQTREVKADDIIGSNEDWEYKLNEDQTGVILTGYKGSETVLNIPDQIGGYKVTEIGDYSFQDCDQYTGLVLPETLEEIGTYAFYGCDGFRGDLVIPDTVKTIGEDAFNCSTFDGKLTLSSQLQVIDHFAFGNCNFTGKLELPAGLQRIGSSAFTSNEFTGELIIPDGVTTIQEAAFAHGGGFTKLQLSSKLERIDKNAFLECTGIKGKLSIPDTVTYIGEGAFWRCKSLEEVTIPTGVSWLRINTFGEEQNTEHEEKSIIKTDKDADDIRRCEKCGASISTEAKFCVACGAETQL